MESAPRNAAFALAALCALAGFALGDYGLLAWAAGAVLAALGVVLHHPRGGVLATSALGLAASGYLFVRKLDASGQSICNVDTRINCDVVNSSEASMLAGLPIALLGSAFFVGMGLASVVLTPSRGTRLFQASALFGAVGLGYSVYLAWQAWLIGAVCVMCMTIYACNGLLVFAGFRGVRDETGGGSLTDGLDEVLRSTGWITVGGTFLFATLVGQSYWAGHKPVDAAALLAAPKPKPGAPPPPPAPVDALSTTYVSRGDVPLEGDEPVLGNPNGRIQIVEYADYLCPHCAQAFPLMHELVESNPEVGLRFRVFPLTGECNPMTSPGNHPERCAAAMAAQCAQDQGKFWDMAGLLFANQRQMGNELIMAAAQQVGLELETFAVCMSDPKTLEQVQRDGIAGAQLQIYGTPAFYVRGLTPGGGWAESCSGPLGVVQLLKAVEAGQAVPASSLSTCPRE
jgi:protein-disulfide isomerase/uncharacterized membrane protein